MFKNYLKIAFRNLVKHKTYSFINILGLAIGLVCTILILLWVQDELSYNQFHKNGEHIFKVIRDVRYSDSKTEYSGITPALLGPALKEEIPEIIETARFLWEERVLFKVGNKKLFETGRYADASLFDMFSFPFVVRNSDIFKGMYSIVISEATALKYFGERNIIGKTITVCNQDGENDFIVTGIFKNIPDNSSLRFDFIIPLAEYFNRNQWALKWGTKQFRTFIQLSPSVSQNVVDNKIKDFAKKHYEYASYELFLHPFTDMYLQPDFKEGRKAGGRIEYVRLFSLVAFFILMIACINYVNLSIAKSFLKTREVGIRKVVGAQRISLILLYISESFIITTLSMGFAIIICESALPFFNALTGKSIVLPFTDIGFLFSLLGIILLTSILSGSYPAFFLSSFSTVNVLKGSIGPKAKKGILRKGLIIVQFITSIAMITCTFIIGSQIHFIKDKNAEMDRENLLQFRIYHGIKQHLDTFKRQVLKCNGISHATYSMQSPLSIGCTTDGVKWNGKPAGDKTAFQLVFTDHDFIKTFNLKLKQGRDFSSAIITDKKNYIINDIAAQKMNLSNPMNNRLSFWGNEGSIIGVVSDYYYDGISNPLEPLIISIAPENCNNGYVRIKKGMVTQALENLEHVYKKFEPDYPFEYTFLDEEYEQMYKSELLMGTLANGFTLLAIIISCFGLYGIASFATSLRTKEVGIRKVLGSSVTALLHLLTKEYVVLVIVANLFAWPVSWYAMNQWLQNFAYRIDLTIWPFLLAGLSALVIALLTISWQAMRAATANPVESLRYE